MKTKIFYLLVFSFLILLGCNKDDDSNNEELPPATQTGAGIFACYVNGQPFIDTSGGYFNCFYQFVDGDYYFGIQGLDEVDMLTSVTIGTEKREIDDGSTYDLLNNIEGNVWAGGRFLLNINSSEFSLTNQNYTGELTITKLDFESHIVSGTFWFNVENPYTGETVEIRDGRFDTLFTQ